MAFFPSFSVAAFGIFCLLHLERCSGSAQTDTKNTARRIDCFKELNVARSLVDFPAFTDGSLNKDTKFPLDNENFVATQCSVVAGLLGMAPVHEPTQPVFLKHSDYAFFVQDKDQPDCAAAVDYWKNAFTNFKGLPEPYKKTETLYRSLQNTSFLVLYNGQKNPSIDCAFFTCPLMNFQQSGAGGDLSTKTADKVGYGLSCVTAPDAYTTGEAPYTEEQWEKIKAGFSGSPRHSEGLAFSPSFFTFVAASLAVAFI